MKIDFTFSIQDWLDLFRRFFGIFENFFRRLNIGIKLFDDEEESTTAAQA